MTGQSTETSAAAVVRRGVTRLDRRLRLERPAGALPLLQTGTLGLLYARGPLVAGELAAAQRVLPQTLTRTLRSLEAAGLIVRRADGEDRRRARLHLTAGGRRALERDMAGRDAWLDGAMGARLTEAERQVLVVAGALMERLAEGSESGDQPGE